MLTELGKMVCPCEKNAGKDMALSSVCIADLWIFDLLSPEESKILSRFAMMKKTLKGQVLFRQGDPADEMLLIKGGRVKLDKVLEDGTEVILDIRKAGDFVGENMLSEEGRYPVSAHCLETTLTCGFNRSQFKELILNNPIIGFHIIKSLSKRISLLTRQMGNLAVNNIEDRLFRVLSNIAGEHGIPSASGLTIQFPLTHEDLSFLIGAHRVSITRAMKTLKHTGKIITQGKLLIIPLDLTSKPAQL
jgi:CRP/FNR family transcriptional regulator, cyclic AMP receptor protein